MKQIKLLLQKLTYRERCLLFTTTFLVSGLLFKFLVIDELKIIHETRSKKIELLSEIQRNESMLADIRKEKNDPLKKSNVSDIRSQNIGTSNLIKQVTEVEKYRREFSLRRLSSLKMEEQQDLRKTTFELEVEAPFNTLGGFLEDLEKSHLLTRVEEVKVFRIERELKLCKAKVLLSSYSWREK